MDILFNNEGTPLMMYADSLFGQTFGSPTHSAHLKKLVFPFDRNDHRYIEVDGMQVLPWGPDNDFPAVAGENIRKASVLNTGLKFLRNLTIGQGIYACTVEGYDDRGNEILHPVRDGRTMAFLQSRAVRRYMEKVLRDYLKFGHGLVQFVPVGEAGDTGSVGGIGGVVGLNPVNVLYNRFTRPDDRGRMAGVISGYWSSMQQPQEYEALPVLSEFDPELDARLLLKKNPRQSFLMCVRDSWSNEDVYSEPIWLPALLSGWIDIAQIVPRFLAQAYKNQITWKWHVQIPYSYWEQKFPPADFASVEERKKAINTYMDRIERNLCGAENAEKPLFTNYAVNEGNGRIEEEWKITPLDNKYKGGDNLVTSAAANSEILFSLMVNPNVLGAGMPGGAYAGNQGGSNIREAFLVNIANAWIDRQNLLDPLELYMRLNGLSACELRFRNTVLTTLDTGAGTKKVLS